MLGLRTQVECGEVGVVYSRPGVPAASVAAATLTSALTCSIRRRFRQSAQQAACLATSDLGSGDSLTFLRVQEQTRCVSSTCRECIEVMLSAISAAVDAVFAGLTPAIAVVCCVGLRRTIECNSSGALVPQYGFERIAPGRLHLLQSSAVNIEDV